jgi:hypothetical protein
MPKDVREMLRQEHTVEGNLSKGHRKKFEARLQRELHTAPRRSYTWMKWAASVILIIGFGATAVFFNQSTTVEPATPTNRIESLGSISPDLKKIENYYLANIQTEIVSLEETPENKELIDGYLEKISELSTDYKQLTEELNTDGINENTINALIENLQLRLKLLNQLKEQLNELNKLNLKENENLQV